MPRAGHHSGAVTLAGSDPDTLALSGVLTFATAAEALTRGEHALATGTQMHLDLAGVTHADSAGLACVLALAASAERAGRHLDVVHWPEGLRALAEVCDVLDLFEAPVATGS